MSEAPENPDTSNRELNELLIEAATALRDGQEGADELIMRFMELVAQYGATEAPPNPYSELDIQAGQAQISQDWDLMRRCYERGVELAKENQEPWQHVRFLTRMSFLSYLQGDFHKAYEWSGRAVAEARGPGSPILEGALEQFARCALRLGKAEETCAAADEGLKSLQDSPLMSTTGADFLVLRAQGHLMFNNSPAAKADLANAWRLLERQQSLRCVPGIQWRIGEWWRVEALWREETGDWEATSQAWERSIRAFRAAAKFWETTGWIGDAAVANNKRAIRETLLEYASAAERAGQMCRAEELRFNANETESN